MNSPGYVQHACVDEKCGVTYLVPDHINQQARRLGDKRTVYCPNGHMWHYTRSEADTLREENERIKRDLDGVRGTLEDRRNENAYLRKLAAYWKGQARRGKR